MMRKINYFGLLLTIFSGIAIAVEPAQPKPATEHTKKINAQYLTKLPLTTSKILKMPNVD